MTHVSAGDLQAYIDGTLIDDRESEARRIEEHLGTCRECELLFEQESSRKVYDILTPILEIPPGLLDSPDSFDSFEEIKARAAALGQADNREEVRATPIARLRKWDLRLSLQWAATVLVSLGGGWMIGTANMATRFAGDMPENAVSEVSIAPDIQLLSSMGLLRDGEVMPELPEATLGVPGLDVTEIRLRSALRGAETGILIVQELPDGRLVEVHHIVIPGMLSPDGDVLEQARELYALGLPEGWELEVLLGPRPGELTVLRGPLTEAELIELGERVVLPER